jgi:hypothetical protein
MVYLRVRIYGLGLETADLLVHELLSRTLRDRKAVARYAGLTGSPDESGSKRTSSTQGPADGAGRYPDYGTRFVPQLGAPDAAFAARGSQRCSCENPGVASRSVQRVEDDQPRIIDPTIRIFESFPEFRLERLAGKFARKIEASGLRQQLATTEMVVQHESERNHPGRALFPRMRQHETQRTDDVRRGTPQHFPLDQRFAHEAEFIILKIPQAAMDQFSGTRARSLPKIVLLA